MLLEKSKIVKSVLNALMILLIVSGCKTSPEWTWVSDFYVADHTAQDIYNDDGLSVKCSEPEFDNYACLHYDNIVELEANIEKFRQEYRSLVGFWKASIKSAIEKRQGQDVDDLQALLDALNSDGKLLSR